MTDIEIKRSGELMVSQVSGLTEEAIEFVDSYVPSSAQMYVVDRGRIILGDNDVDEFVAACSKRDLTVQRWFGT